MQDAACGGKGFVVVGGKELSDSRYGIHPDGVLRDCAITGTELEEERDQAILFFRPKGAMRTLGTALE
jgi:hypothetical protein